MIDQNYLKLLEQTFIFASCYLQDEENADENLKKLALLETDLKSRLEEYNTLIERQETLKAVN